MKFKKYNSIENTYDKEYLDRVVSENPEECEYVVQEKVHGANSCFIVDGDGVLFAKRTGVVEEGEAFYGYESVLMKYKDEVVKIAQQLRESYPATTKVFIYGELFGGSYPHKDVVNNPKIKSVQKGVFYYNDVDFYSFDIYIFEKESGAFLPVHECECIFSVHGMMYARALFRGSLDECLSYPNAFQTTIPDYLCLPRIEDNICEGVVIRPEVPWYLSNGSRVLLKNKNEKFAEKKQKSRREVTIDKEVESRELADLKAEAARYVTENRLNNVISRIGSISYPKEIGKLIGVMSKDTLEDFLKENSSQYISLGKSEQKLLNGFINHQAVLLIKKHFES